MACIFYSDKLIGILYFLALTFGFLLLINVFKILEIEQNYFRA